MHASSGNWLNRLVCFVMLFYSGQSFAQKTSTSPVVPSGEIFERGFITPPDSIQTGIYWYWLNDNISKEGVVRDLESMKAAGINRAFIGNISLEGMQKGKVKFFSEEWWEIMHTALKTATRLNIQIGIFNSPGWSQSGGPWVKPSETMRYLNSVPIQVKGGQMLDTELPKPKGFFQDVRVIAFPVPADFDNNLGFMKPVVHSNPVMDSLYKMMDGDTLTEVRFSSFPKVHIDFETESDFTARSVYLIPSTKKMKADLEVQVKEGDHYKTIRKYIIDRSNDEINVGFKPYGPVAISIPEYKGKMIRLQFMNISGDFGLREVRISSSPVVESYIEKTLAKMCQTPFPLWGQYFWQVQPVVTDSSLLILPRSVQDISKYMTADGKLNWNVPVGNWVILRTGMTATGAENDPAPAGGKGLEVDKMNKDYLENHFNGFLGEIMKRIPAEDRKTWKIVVEDSYEKGGQNWTDDFIGKFKNAFGYDPTPFIPVMYGYVIGSEDQSDRFLWDLRRFVANQVSFEYVGGLRDISHKYGFTTWLENYGHWGFPGEFLQYGGQSDEVAGEFWSEGDLGNIENRTASSCAHTYGKNKVSAESFTCGFMAYSRFPASLKARGDRFFTEGINNSLLHVYIHQPDENKYPGVNADFGNEFNRHNIWFDYIDMFTLYLKRSNYMLQQGRYVADVAYFIGEDAPKMTGIADPAIPRGYSFDYINADIIENFITVKNGRLILPSGIEYRILVLPRIKTMRPKFLKRLQELVDQGAVILGSAPDRSPSLQNYPQSDLEIKKMSTELWGKVDGYSVKQGSYGKGMVLDGMDLTEALNLIQAPPDCKMPASDSTLFIHRKTTDADIYYISNQQNRQIEIRPEFNVSGKIPELFDPVSGKFRLLPAYVKQGNYTIVPMKLAAAQSLFVVFRSSDKSSKEAAIKDNFPAGKTLLTISTPWSVQFINKKFGAPEKSVQFKALTDWTESTDEKIKYYSGVAIYSNRFVYTNSSRGDVIVLDLGKLNGMAKIRVNGIDLGGVWTAPYQLDITKALKAGNNDLEVYVVNNWMNRMIGDLALPAGERTTWSSVNPYSATSPLQPSGLLGPVVLKSYSKSIK